MEESSARRRQIIATLAVLIVIVAIVGAVAATTGDDTNSSGSMTTPTTTTSQTETTSDPDATYKDGTYTATGGYNSPGGSETISVTVTIAGNEITDTSATSGATNTEAEQYQEDFINAYAELVIGKSINDVELSRVAGASLTSIGSNNALEQIKSQAEA
jgi:uncharacterized protein with FMN-binding domain